MSNLISKVFGSVDLSSHNIKRRVGRYGERKRELKMGKHKIISRFN